MQAYNLGKSTQKSTEAKKRARTPRGKRQDGAKKERKAGTTREAAGEGERDAEAQRREGGCSDAEGRARV